MNPNIDFELFTQRVYQKLVNNSILKPISVQHNVKLKGKSGCEHQIDVYWEYETNGKLYRTAIECKNFNTSIPIGRVRDFFGVLYDLGNVNGIMVSSKEYQEGSLKFAETYGISLKMLKNPDAKDIIGSITTRNNADIRHLLFKFDEDWIAERHFDLDKLRKFLSCFNHKKSNYWSKAEHFPIETKNTIIRDSNGKHISSIEKLEQQLPDNIEIDSPVVFSFEDAWVESIRWGPIKIREVKFEQESKVQETTLNLAADDFVEAILEDAVSKKTNYIPKW